MQSAESGRIAGTFVPGAKISGSSGAGGKYEGTFAPGAKNSGSSGSGGRSAGGAETPADGPQAGMPVAKEKEQKRKRGLSYAEEREYKNLEREIEELEEQCASFEEQMAGAACDYEKLAQLGAQKEEAEKKLEEKMERYFELEEKL